LKVVEAQNAENKISGEKPAWPYTLFLFSLSAFYVIKAIEYRRHQARSNYAHIFAS
jgi:hypothetical protein